MISAISGAFLEFQAAVLKALPRDLTDDDYLSLARNGEGLTKFLAGLTLEGLNLGNETDPIQVAPQYPPNGVEFELTINEPFTGLEMVRRFGYEPAGWKFNGTEITKPVTKRFKLVPIGAQPTFKAFEAENARLGIIPDGQWMDAFKKAFPQPDGNGPIGIAKASWVRPHGDAYFPYVRTGGGLNFGWTDGDFYALWRGLVVVQAV